MTGKTSGRTKASRAAETDATGIALVASAIGNLWQAGDRADLQRDRDFLIAAIQDWQADHARLAARVASLQKTYEAVEEANATLRSQAAELEKEKLAWRTKFFEASVRLGKRVKKPSVATPAEVVGP